MKLIPEKDVIKPKKDDKRNTKKRFLVTDGICFLCGCIVNYEWEKACLLCCGYNEFLVGEPGHVLRELLELDIEQVRIACELRGISGSGSGSRVRLTLELFKSIFPKLTKVDNRINENLIQKIIYRNRRRFWYVRDIEDAISDIRRSRHNIINIKLVDIKDMVEG